MAVLTEQTQLNLYNFDKPEAQESRYVLTSPRSLEACSRLKVKPLNLLPKSLQRFEKEHDGKSEELIKLLYEQWDRKRLKNLDRCRRARENMIKEEFVSVRKSLQPPITVTNKQNRDDGKVSKSYPSNNDSKQQQKTTIAKQRQKTTLPPTRQDKQQVKKLVKKPDTKPIDLDSKRKNVKFAPPPVQTNHTPRKSKSTTSSNKIIPVVNTSTMQTDRKLIELMRSRLERNEKEEDAKMVEWKKWSDAKKRGEEKKRQQIVKLGKEVARSHQRWERQMKEIEERRKKEEKKEEEEKLCHLEETDHHHELLIDKQRRLKFSEVEQRKLENERKKIRHAQILNNKKKDITEFQKSTEVDLKRKMEKAEKLRMENEYKELQSIKSMNKKERERFEVIKKQLEKQRIVEEERKLREIRHKLNKAEELRLTTLEEISSNISCNAADRNRRMEEIRKKHEQITKENKERKLQAIDEKDEQIKKAEEIIRTNFIHRSSRALEKRTEYERKWKMNYHKLHQHHENIRKKTQEEIEMKETRLLQHLQQKEARLHITRKFAHAHQVQREQLKKKYTNFNKMAQQASLANSVGRGPRTGLVNRSKLGLMCG